MRDCDAITIRVLQVRVIGTPCHTPGHVCYYLPYGDGAVITGDTLFIAGCGLFFDGTPAQVQQIPVDCVYFLFLSVNVSVFVRGCALGCNRCTRPCVRSWQLCLRRQLCTVAMNTP